MTGVAFLGLALVIFLVGSFILWVSSRERQSLETSIDQFQNEMGAIKPPADDTKPPGAPTG